MTSPCPSLTSALYLPLCSRFKNACGIILFVFPTHLLHPSLDDHVHYNNQMYIRLFGLYEYKIFRKFSPSVLRNVLIFYDFPSYSQLLIRTTNNIKFNPELFHPIS